MVALVFACLADLLNQCESKAYKVTDSNEEYPDDHTKDFTKSFTGDSSSGGFYGSGFHFPDFFNDGNQDIEGGNGFGSVSPFVSSFPALSESRSSDSVYVVPAHTYSTGKGFVDGEHHRIPLERSSLPRDIESRNSKKPITTLYDDWKPGDERPRNNKWSQEHVDDDSSEVAVSSGRNSYPSTPYRGQNNYGKPYSEASLRQHYKPLRPVGKTHGTNYAPGDGDVRTHQYKYGVSHIYDPKKKISDEPSYERYEDKLQDRKPQQFSSNPHHHYKSKISPSPGSYSESSPRGKSSFKPSPPDYYRNSRTDRNYDFFSDASKLAPKKVKTPKNPDHLDKSCVKTNKTKTINISDEPISLNCYECYDKKQSRPYEQCIEVSKSTKNQEASQKRVKRNANDSNSTMSPSMNREKRQYDDYYEGEGGNYGPDSSDYRFGPEHFSDDYSAQSYDEGDGDVGSEYDSEKCSKTRKGEMLCITCENRSGGTYKQCSYASDPKKNSYERSVSKVYGSPRLPEENRRKQVDSSPGRPVPSKRRPYRYPPPSGPSGPSDPSGYGSDGPEYSRPTSSGRKVASKGVPPRDYDEPPTKYRGSQGRSPLPARGAPRSNVRTPASTQLRTSPRSNIRSNPRALTGSTSPDRFRYGLNRNPPPPSSRAYSTPSPLALDSYSYDIPDPYSPDPAALGGGMSDGRHGARNRKNIDPLFDPGYDETFASLFPELVDGVDSVDSVDPSSAVALAPAAYDEYDTGDYDEGPERRTDLRNYPKRPPTSESSITHRRSASNPRSFTLDKSSCKKIRKNKMNCYQCVDDAGTKHEECMYVAESEPKSKHTTYREIKELRYDPSSNPDQENHNHELTNGTPNDNNHRGKRKFKKFEPNEQHKSNSAKDGTVSSMERNGDFQRRPSDLNRNRYNMTVQQENRNTPTGGHKMETREKREDVEDPEEKTNYEIEKSTRKNYNPIPTDPPELDTIGEKHSENGEFSADLELKYDPDLGLSLPKYMLEKSEHEAIFDEVLGASGKE